MAIENEMKVIKNKLTILQEEFEIAGIGTAKSPGKNGGKNNSVTDEEIANIWSYL